MSSGGSSGGSTTTTQSGPPKEVLQAYQGLVGAASNVASQPLQQYTDPLVAGFTPQQQAGFQTIDNAQGIGFPYINAAAQQYGQATAPLWDDLPQFDTQPLANAGSAAIANNPGFWGPALNESNYAFALAQGAPGQVDPYAQKARDYGDYASTVGGRTASGVQGYLSPALGYANQVGSMAPGIPGQVAPYSGYGIGAANSAQRGINLPGYDTLPTYLSPYTKNVTDALKDLFNQQNAEQFQQIRGNATTQGAYGGDREAVAEAITARQQQLGQAPAFSQALQSGFAQAQNELNTQQQIEQARQQAERQNAIAAGQLGIGSGNLALSGYTGAGQLGLGASGAATGAGNLYSTTNLGAGQLGIGAGNLNLGGGNLTLGGLNAGIQGSLGAAGSALGAGNLNLAGGQQGFGEFNTQQAQKLAADQANRWLASQAGFGMASLGNQALSQALTGANAQIGAGALQQQLAQEQLNIPYQQFLQAQAYPYQQLSFLSPIVEGTGSLSGGKGSTTYPGPSALSQIGGLGAAATGLSGLFGSGSGSSSGGSDFGGDYGGGFGGGPNDAFAKSGGRIGYAKGGTTPEVPGIGQGVPILDLSYIPTETDNPVKSTWGLGIGNNNSSTSSGGGGGGGSFLSGIGSAVSAANTIGDAFGGGGILEGIGSLFLLKDGGRAGFAMGGDTADPSQSDPTKLDPTRWSLPKVPQINLDHIIPRNAGPAIKQGKGPPELSPMPQQMPGQPQDSGLKGIGDLGKSLKGMNLFGSSDDSSDSADKGYAGGGVPLSAAINFGGAPPNQSMQVDQLRQMPLERLREMAVRYPPNTQQGQIVAKIIAEKQMTPGSGAASTGAPGQAPAPTGGMGSGGGYDAAQISGPAAGGMGGQPQDYGGTSHLAHGGEADEEPGFVTEDELDPHPIVDHSGDSVVIRYPSEGKTLDLGLPSIKEDRRHYASGGASGAGHNMPLLGTQQAEPFAAPGEGARYSAAPFISNLPTAGGVSIPQLSAGFYTQPLRAQPGGGLGNWFQPMPQLTKFGTGPNGSTIFPSATAYTPGMAGVISGLTKGKGTIPPEFGGSAAATSASSTPSPFDGIDPITAEFFGFGNSDSGGKRGGRIGFAEGGEMDDPSEAPPPRVREPDDSGLSAAMPSEREVATRRLDSLLRKYEPKPGAPAASGREFSANLETYGPEKPPPRTPRSPPPDLPSAVERETASKSIDDLMAKYERPKPPVHGFSDIPPPERPVPDDREFTAPMPERDTREFTAPTPGGGIGNQVDINRALDDPAYRQLIIPDIASPGSGPAPDTAPTTFGQTGPVFDTSGADLALAGIGGALQGSPEEEAVARGVPVEQVRAERNKKVASQVAEQPSGGMNLPSPGIGATAAIPPPASGIGAPAEAYRDTSRLTDIAGAPPIPPPSIPEPFKSVMTEPAVAPAKPAAAPTPSVTRVTSPPQVTGTGKPYTPATPEGKQAAAETAPAGKITEAQLRAQYDAAKRIPNNAGQSESWEQYRARNTDMLHQDGVQTLLPDAAPNPDAKLRTQEEIDAKVPPGQGSGTGGVKGLSPMMSPVADALLNSPEAKQLGLTKANAAGILGHLPVESYGGDPTAFNPNDPNGGSRGVMQWQPDRWQNGLAWASKNGIADFATNANAQARFGLYEVLSGTDGSGGRTLAALKEAGDDPVKSALAWNHFERGAGYTPGNPERMIASDQRQYNAERILGALNGGTPFEIGTSPGRSRGMPSGGSGGGGPRQPGPGEPEQVTADKNGAPKVTPAGQPVVDAFKKDLTQRTEPKDRGRLKAWMDSPSFLLFLIGAGMLSSRSPFPGVALGEGLALAGKSALELRKDQSKEELTEARLGSLAGRVEAGQANLAERTRHNTQTEEAAKQRIADAAKVAEAHRERDVAKAQQQADAAKAAADRAGATIAEKQREFDTKQELARQKADAEKPMEIKSQDEQGNPITHLIPPGKYNDRSSWITVGSTPKAAGLTQKDWAAEVTKLALADTSYLSDPDGAMDRAEKRLEKLGIRRPGSQPQAAPTFDPNKPATPYTGP